MSMSDEHRSNSEVQDEAPDPITSPEHNSATDDSRQGADPVVHDVSSDHLASAEENSAHDANVLNPEVNEQTHEPHPSSSAAASIQEAHAGVSPLVSGSSPVAHKILSARAKVTDKAADKATSSATAHKDKDHHAQRIQLNKAVVAGFFSAFVLVLLIAGGIFGLNHMIAPRSQDASSNRAPITINAKDTDTSVAKAAAQKALPSVVSISVQKAQGQAVGSGVMLNTDGNILTNYHVIRDAQAVSITTAGKTYAATVVGSDPSSDVAVLKADLEGDSVTPIEQGDSSKLQVGDWVMSVGSPYGLSQSVSSGIVSSLGRNQSLTTRAGTTLYINLIQTDASINPGNSGGALVNEEGKLVGICTLFSSTSGAFSGVGFAIPSNYALSIANKIMKGEKVTHAYIGLLMQTINSQNAHHYKLPVSAGAYVVDTMPDGPAARAGIKKGDIITSVDGHEINSADDMTLAVRSHEVGQTIKVGVQRGKDKMEFDVTLASDEEIQKERELFQQRQKRRPFQRYAPQDDGSSDPDATPDGDDSDSQDELYQRFREFLQKRAPRR